MTMKKILPLCVLVLIACLSTNSLADESAAMHGGSRSPLMPVTTPNRSIYLNGVDVSSARNQDLRNVHIKISENGDLFISAPQYQVTEEETFMPLSSYTTKSLAPAHKAPQAMRDPSNPDTAKAIEKPASDKASNTKSGAEKPNTPAQNAPAQPASAALPKTGG